MAESKLDPQDIADLEVAATMRMLVQSEGWDHYSRIVKARMKEMEQQILTPYRVARVASSTYLSAEDWDEVQRENKGALIGLRLALDTPAAIIANADDILTRIPPEQRHVVGE